MKFLFYSFFLSSLFVGSARGQKITTVANNGTFFVESNFALNANNNFIIADGINVNKVSLEGTVTIIAGNGNKGFGGDGGRATLATLNYPVAVAIDSSGNIFIADAGNHRIRKVDVNGIITTVAGKGIQGFSGDGGVATFASLSFPWGVAIDATNNLIIADWGNSCIRKVSTTGIITTVAGTGGYRDWGGGSGDGGQATLATLNTPKTLAFDAAGNLYIGDNDRIRKVNTNGIVSTFAGTGQGHAGDGGPATSASFGQVGGIAVTPGGSIVVADSKAHCIREINTSGIINTIAGIPNVSGFSGDEGDARGAQMAAPYGLVVDHSGAIFIGTNYRIRKILPSSPPSITGFTPATANNGSIVNISGEHFFGTNNVTFGGTSASSYTVTSDSTINAVVANAGSSGNVSVVTRGGLASKAGFTFVFIPPPTVTSFTPTSAKSETPVTITGTNFLNASSVLFGSTPATSFIIHSATSITAIVGEGSSGNVSVTTQGGTATRAGFTFTGPTISGFSPGLAMAGQTINITGTNFTGVSAVRFGNVHAASFTVNSSTNISAVLGSGASGGVSVVTTNGTANRAGFLVIPVPTITSFTPDKAGPGITVTIVGSGFTGGAAGSGFWVPAEVRFGDVAAQSFSAIHSDTIKAKVAFGASGNVFVRTAGGTAIKEGFAYFPAPVIYNFSPQSAGTGDTITISGNNFTGATGVAFGGTKAASFTVVNSTTITAVLASGAPGNITVITPGGTVSSTSFFTFHPRPVIQSFSPQMAGSGTNITITGSNFSGASVVRFGGVAAASFVVVNATTIKAVVGLGSTGDVSVITPGGTATIPGYTFAIPPPTIASFYPRSAIKGAEIIIEGTALLSTKNVFFGAKSALSFTVVSDTVIKAVVGYGSSGTVTLTTSAGEASRIGFIYNPLSVITSFTQYGSSNDAVTIAGVGFTGTTRVAFGGVAAASFTVKSSTKIIASPGNGNSGNISVTTPNGTVTKPGFLFVQNTCPGSSMKIFSTLTGINYQWQVNSGNGFTNIAGSNYSGINTQTLQIANIPNTWYNYQYRCLVNGETTDPIILRFANRWNGTINNAWENASNWGCSTLPTSNSVVEIPTGIVTVNSDVAVRSVRVQEGANLKVTTGKAVFINGTRDSVFPGAKAEPVKIEKVSMEAGHALIFFVSPGLILMPGETTTTSVRQLNDNPADTLPSGVIYSSSDNNVASIAANGTVTARRNGSCLFSATDAAGRKAYFSLYVSSRNVPDLTKPFFAGFEKPLFLLSDKTGGQIKVHALNRKGQIVSNAVSISLAGNKSVLQGEGNTNYTAKEGSYTVRANVGQTNLEGETVALFYNNEASGLFDSVKQDVSPKVFSVSLGPGKYPQYFTHVNMSSEPVIGLVYRLLPYKVMASGVWTGTYGMTISTTEEQINVETENNSVLSASGSRIVSLKEGVGRWRVIIENYFGEWYSSQVFADFSGEWICKNDKRGKSIKMTIPEVASKVFYAGHYASLGELGDYYGMNWYAGSLAQIDNGKATFTDNVTGQQSSIINVQAGPGLECLICNFQTIQRAFGALHFIDQNRQGSIRFADRNQMLMSEADSSLEDLIFVRSVTQPEGVMSTKIDDETFNMDQVFGNIGQEDEYYFWRIESYYYWKVDAGRPMRYYLAFLGEESQENKRPVPVPGVTYNARLMNCPVSCNQPQYNVNSGYAKYNEAGNLIGYSNFETCELVFTRVDAYRWEGSFKASGALYDASDNKTGQVSSVTGTFSIPVE